MTAKDLAPLIDHTLLRPAVTREDLERHCREAIEHGFRAVCLFPSRLRAASAILSGSGVRLAAVVAFPHGASTLLSKIFEGLEAWKQGASELDIVLSLHAIASGERDLLEEEIRTIMEKTRECRHKFIVEAGLFSEDQLLPVLRILDQRRPAFVKTSTGVNAPGASASSVAFLRSRLHASIGIKASGRIRTLDQVRDLVAAGATCIGTSAGIDLMRQAGL